MTKKKWAWIVFLAPLFIAGFIVIGGELVLHLWNWLAPTLFGWRQITFWQAVGLLAICRILFGSHGGRGFSRFSPRRQMTENWERMTPEEREKFRQAARARWGGCVTPTGGTNEPASS